MSTPLRYAVIRLPSKVALAEHCTLTEAAAFLRGYHEVSNEGLSDTVIVAEVAPNIETHFKTKANAA